jgi:hypothetical protein
MDGNHTSGLWPADERPAIGTTVALPVGASGDGMKRDNAELDMIKDRSAITPHGFAAISTSTTGE